MNIVTGYRGEAHITSQQDQAKNQGIFGSGSYILDVGQKLHAEAVSANEVRIYDGVLSHQGVVAVVEKNTYDSVTITSGSQGVDRCDLIVARYTKEGSTGVESMTFEVIMGTEGETTPPAYNTGDIQAGDSPVDMPIYEVHLSGIQIESLVPVAPSVGDIVGAYEQLRSITERSSSTYYYDGLEITAEKIGRVVRVRVGGKLTSVMAGSGTKRLCTLAEPYRPVLECALNPILTAAGDFSSAIVRNSGVVDIGIIRSRSGSVVDLPVDTQPRFEFVYFSGE